MPWEGGDRCERCCLHPDVAASHPRQPLSDPNDLSASLGGMAVLSCCENPTWQQGRKALGTEVQSSTNAAAWCLLPLCHTAHCIPHCIPTKPGQLPLSSQGRRSRAASLLEAAADYTSAVFPVQFLTNLGCLQPGSCRAGKDGWPGSPTHGQTAGPC